MLETRGQLGSFRKNALRAVREGRGSNAGAAVSDAAELGSFRKKTDGAPAGVPRHRRWRSGMRKTLTFHGGMEGGGLLRWKRRMGLREKEIEAQESEDGGWKREPNSAQIKAESRTLQPAVSRRRSVFAAVAYSASSPALLLGVDFPKGEYAVLRARSAGITM